MGGSAAKAYRLEAMNCPFVPGILEIVYLYAALDGISWVHERPEGAASNGSSCDQRDCAQFLPTLQALQSRSTAFLSAALQQVFDHSC